MKSLGPNRLTMTPAEIFAAADTEKDGKLSYVEFSACIFRLNALELTAHLKGIIASLDGDEN